MGFDPEASHGLISLETSVSLPHTPAQLRSIGTIHLPRPALVSNSRPTATFERWVNLLNAPFPDTCRLQLITAVKRAFCRTHVLTSARPLDSVVHVSPITPTFLLLPSFRKHTTQTPFRLGSWVCRCGQFLVPDMATLGLLAEHEASMSSHAMPCHIIQPDHVRFIQQVLRPSCPPFLDQLRIPRSWLGPGDPIQKSRPPTKHQHSTSTATIRESPGREAGDRTMIFSGPSLRLAVA